MNQYYFTVNISGLLLLVYWGGDGILGGMLCGVFGGVWERHGEQDERGGPSLWLYKPKAQNERRHIAWGVPTYSTE